MTKVELVKELRARTQASMSECLKALEASNNDIEAAIVWLRENGAVKAVNKLKNSATDGVVLAKTEGNKAVIIEINCQTDFVAKNENFMNFANAVLDQALATAKSSEDFEKLTVNGKSLYDASLELTSITGEKVAFRRGEVLVANENQTLGAYTHNNNRVGAIVLLEGKNDSEPFARNVAMHAASMRPRFLNDKLVDAEWLSSEKSIIENSVEHDEALKKKLDGISDESKKKMILDKTLEGRLNKVLAENCLVKQSYILKPEQTVEQYLNKLVAVSFYAWEVGEGMEKAPQMSFADEVAAQMKK